MRIVTDTRSYMSKTEGYGLFGALNIAIDRVERNIVSTHQYILDQRETQESSRFLLEEMAELEDLE